MLTRSEIRGTPEMRILIIEDDNETAAYLGKALREAGHVTDR
jgi:DNA-binding response OmpR family regulator